MAVDFLCKVGSVQFLRRYWAPGLILLMVVSHAAVIIVVRARVAQLSSAESRAVSIGSIRFQNVNEPQFVYEFQLHAVVDPAIRRSGEDALARVRLEIIESAEQRLRQVDVAWLADPAHKDIRGLLMGVVLKHLDEPLVQRVVLTDWLRLSSQLPRHDAA